VVDMSFSFSSPIIKQFICGNHMYPRLSSRCKTLNQVWGGVTNPSLVVVAFMRRCFLINQTATYFSIPVFTRTGFANAFLDYLKFALKHIETIKMKVNIVITILGLKWINAIFTDYMIGI